MLQYHLLRLSPSALRYYRAHMLVDTEKLASFLPPAGRVLDVGCGVGALTYELARLRPDLDFYGIDINAKSIALARRYHGLFNLSFDERPLATVDEQFDCVLFVDVMHHAAPADHAELLAAARCRLSGQGYIVIKDIERRGGFVSLWMDRYISRCKAEEINLFNCDEMSERITGGLRVMSAEVKFRFPFPNYYIKAR